MRKEIPGLPIKFMRRCSISVSIPRLAKHSPRHSFCKEFKPIIEPMRTSLLKRTNFNLVTMPSKWSKETKLKQKRSWDLTKVYWPNLHYFTNSSIHLELLQRLEDRSLLETFSSLSFQQYSIRIKMSGMLQPKYWSMFISSPVVSMRKH